MGPLHQEAGAAVGPLHEEAGAAVGPLHEEAGAAVGRRGLVRATTLPRPTTRTNDLFPMPVPFPAPTPSSRALALALATLLAAVASGCSECARTPPAPGTSLGLGRYTVGGIFPLEVREASAVVWYPDHDTLLVLGDHSDFIVEVDQRGQTLSSMSMHDFQDTEGLTHREGPRFFLAEEGTGDVVAFEYAPGSQLHRKTLESWSVAPESGNRGLEGLSFDPGSGLLLATREQEPRAVYEIVLDEAPVAQVRPLFDAEALPVGDLAGIQVLSTVSRLARTPAARNVLLLSQESSRLLEIDRDGKEVDSRSVRLFSSDPEGVTVDATGRIFVVGESSLRTPGSALLVLEPPPEDAPAEHP